MKPCKHLRQNADGSIQCVNCSPVTDLGIQSFVDWLRAQGLLPAPRTSHDWQAQDESIRDLRAQLDAAHTALNISEASRDAFRHQLNGAQTTANILRVELTKQEHQTRAANERAEKAEA